MTSIVNRGQSSGHGGENSSWRQECLTALEGMRSGANQCWEMEWKAYNAVFACWGPEISRRAVAHAVLNRDWRPSVGELRHTAADLESPTPSPDMALTEMLTLLRRFGSHAAPHPGFPDRPNIRAEGEPRFSHPLVLATVRRIGGWASIASGEAQMQEGGLSGAFRHAYERAQEDWRLEVMRCLEDGVHRAEFFHPYKPFEESRIGTVAREWKRQEDNPPKIEPRPRGVNRLAEIRAQIEGLSRQHTVSGTRGEA